MAGASHGQWALHRSSTCFAGRDTAATDGLLPPGAGCGILAAPIRTKLREDMMRRWHRFLALIVLTALASPAVAQDYPTRSIRAIASQGAGRPERHLDARACRRTGAGARHHRRGRGPRRRGGHDRRARLRRIGARRLHHLHPADRGDGHQSDHLSQLRLRSEEEPRADHQGVLPDAGVRGERVARRQVVSRPDRAHQGQAEDDELHGAVAVEGRLHGRPEQEERHRLRARAVQGRRRRGQQHAHRHDADRDFGIGNLIRSSATARSSGSPSTATSARRSLPRFRPSGRSATRST